MESIVNSIISSYLADYLEINPEKTKLSILSGTVDLYGVKFKTNLFETLNLPYLELVDGYIGKIHVDLSLPRFYLYPINVLVDKIYVKVKPKNMNKIKEEEILKAFGLYKNKRLKQFEEMMNIKFSSLFENDKTKEKNNNKKESLTILENLINNLHIKIINIVFIYDDCISNPKYPVTLGVTINQIFIDSTSKDFKYKELSDEEKLSPFKYKKLSMENMNIFLDNIKPEDIITKNEEIYTKLKIKEETRQSLDESLKKYLGNSIDFYLYCESEIKFYSKDSNYHSYLLRDLNPEIRLIINENFYNENNKEPQIDLTVDIKTISLEVSNKQIKALTNTINYISLKDFYQQTIIDNYLNKVEKIDNDLIRNYLEEYSQYYKTKYIDEYKNDKENKKFLNNMEKIEKNLRIDNIIALRDMGKDTINNMIEVGKLEKEIKNSEGGFFSFFRSKNNEEINKLKAERDKKIKEQKELQLKNSTLNQFKNYISGMLQNDKGEQSKEDKEEFKLVFLMEKLNLIIKEENKSSKKIKNIFEINFIRFKSECVIKTASQFIKVTLNDIKLNQFLTENKNYETILYSENINTEQDNKEISLILIEFEHNIKLPISPFSLRLHFDKQIFIIIDYYYLYYLYNLFLKHISTLDFNNLSSLVNDKITSIVKIGYNKLMKEKSIQEEKEENNKLFNINIDISLTAPILLFPLNFRDKNNKQMLYISLGILEIKSKLADTSNEKEIYDKYMVKLSNFIMKTIDIYNSKEIIKDNIGEKIFYKTSFNIEVNNYIFQNQKKEHKNEEFSPLIININLNNIKLCLSEDQIIFFINYLDNFIRTKNEFDKEHLIKMEKKNKNIIKEKKEKEIDVIKTDKSKEILKDNEKENKEILKQEKQEIINVIKLSIKFESVQLFLLRNLNEVRKANFLSFFFKESFLNLLIKSNNSLKMDISFGHFYLHDKDIKIDKTTNKEMQVINPEFRYIVGTTLFDFNTPRENKVKLSEIYNYKNEENNISSEKPINESIKILLNLDSVTNEIDIDIFMCKLTISPNLSTISRAYDFIFKYLDIYNKTFNKYKFISSVPIESEINDDKEKRNNNNALSKIREKSIIKISFKMKGINLLLPINHESSNTYIIYMALEVPIKYTMETDAETFFKDSKTVNVNYLIKSMELIIDIKNGNFSIYEFKEDFIMLNNKNKLINDFQLLFLFNNHLDNKENANQNVIKIYLDKQIELSININQLIIFENLMKIINEFLKEINKEKENTKILDNKKELLDNEDLKNNEKNQNINLKQKESKTLIKKETIKKQNKTYIDIYTYDIRFSNFYIKFYDIIDGLYQPLIEFSMRDTKIEFLQNMNPQDSTNLIEHLKSIFLHDNQNKKTLDNYDKNNFYMYLNVLTNIEITSLNNYLNQWEYFIEPFKIEFYYCQFLKRMIPNIELFINNMININVSLNFAKIMRFVIQKFQMEKEEINETPIDKYYKSNDTPRYLGYETPVLIFENYSGVDMDIWFDNIKYESDNKDLIIRIKSNEKYELTMDLLSKYNVEKKNNNLNSTISYKFILEPNLIKDMNINEKNLIGNNFNINYHQLYLHNINNFVKVSVESCSDNLLIRHIIFSSLISLKNESKFKDLEIYNNSQKIILNSNKRQTIPISWLIEKRNPSLYLILNDKKQLLIKDINDKNNINKFIRFDNEQVMMIDIIKYKLNLDEYYLNKNISKQKEEIFRTDLIITSPIHIMNNTPYDFSINSNEKIIPMKSVSSCPNNSDLLLDYLQKMNDQENRSKTKTNEIIMKIIKDIKLQIFYNNNYISANNYINEKEESNNYYNNNENTLILLKNDNSKEYLICRLILYNPYKTILFDNTFYKEMKTELNSFRYEIIFDYYFVNKTCNNLYFNNKLINSVKSSKDNLLISANKNLPVSKILLNDKITFRKSEKNWTESFEFSALEKEFILKVKNENESYNAISIIAKISKKFNKSILFIIEEKFIIINELPFEINIKEDKFNNILKFKSKESSALLLDKDILEQKSFLRLGIYNCYSHKFHPSKLGSYDLLVPYDQKIFEKFEINIENKLLEYDSKKYYPIRCVINNIKNSNSIYIIFSLNNEYINKLTNYSSKVIEVYINDLKSKKFKINPKSASPLVYINKDDKYEPFENINIIIDKSIKTEVSINEISNKFCGKNKDYYIQIRPEKNNSNKSITIFDKEDKKLMAENSIKKIIKRIINRSKLSQGLKILLNLEGIGFSFIDETPKEIFYLSFYKLFLNFNSSDFNNNLNEVNIYNSLTFSIKNIQLDYGLDNAYEIIFNPTNQILPPKNEETKKEKNFLDKIMENGDENTPFIQLVMSKKTSQEIIDNKINILYTIYPEIGIIIQEFDARINTILINCIINLINQYIKIFLPDNENKNEIDLNQINKGCNTLIEADNKNIDEIKNQLLNKEENTNKLIINYLTLSAIKANATFKINKNAIEIKFVPELFVTVLNTLCSTLTSFSDVTIKLNEFTFKNVFSDFDSLFTKLFSFYKNELLTQIYRIILNMDLIGNPINLIEGLGTGIFEFFNEPRKGLLKGPEEFGIGIAKGARSLVSNIVGGGFKSASKITGTLLNATKNLSSLGTEEENIIKEEEKPRGFFSGALSGIKKGFGEIASGVTGIVTKPIEQTKKSGFGGFFKGLGSGIVGAVMTPVNTVLTVGNEVTSGISNSEFISNKKSLKRFRYPRTLYKYIPIRPYNEKEEIERKTKRKDIKGTDKIIISLNNELLCLENSTEIIMCNKLNDNNILLFTDIMIKILDKDFKKSIKKIYVCNINKILEKNNKVEIIMKNGENESILIENKKEKNNFINEISKYI